MDKLFKFTSLSPKFRESRNLTPPFFILLIIILLFSACTQPDNEPKEKESFTFAFLTDIHLEYGKNAIQGFTKAIDTLNKLNPEFVITGGDLISDALAANYESADSLYTLYNQVIEKVAAPVYNTIGNHELFGIYPKSGINPDHPEYNTGLFERFIGAPYYSFDRNGWHFMILNSIQETKDRRYIGMVDSIQMEWIKKDLASIGDSMPIVVSTHIPFISGLAQYKSGALQPNSVGLVVSNSREVLDLFENKNLKLVLQGHLHYLEDINVLGKTHFITGGAVSSGWWGGIYNDTEEGFLLIHASGNDISWEYVDYGWMP